MGAVDRRIHRHRPVDQALGIGLGKKTLREYLPDSVGGHPVVPGVEGLPRAETIRQILPRNARPQAVEDAFEHLSGIGERSSFSARTTRKEVLDHLPLGISQQLETRHGIEDPMPRFP